MSTRILRLPTLVLAILCLALVDQCQATACAAVCQMEPPSCPYGQVRSFILDNLFLSRLYTDHVFLQFLREPQGPRCVVQLTDHLQPVQC
jgi:hypothetical protein